MKTQYKIGSLFLVAILSLLVGYTIAQSGNTFIISTGIYPNATTYTISKEGSNYIAKNAYGFQPSWSNQINISDVVTKALGSGSVSISFYSGTYTFSTMVYLPSNILLFGQGSSTIIKSSFVSESIFSTVGFKPATPETSTMQYNITIKNFKFISGGASWGCQTFFNGRATNLVIENNIIDNFKDYGLKVWWGTGISIFNNIVSNIPNGDGIHVTRSSNIRIIGNEVINVQDSLIGLPYDQNVTVSDNILVKTWNTQSPLTNGQGIDISGTNNTIISNNVIDATRAYNGIAILTYGAIHCNNIKINNNIIRNANYSGIDIEGTIPDSSNENYFITISNNEIYKSGHYGIYILRSGYGKIQDNLIVDSSQVSDNSYDDITLDSSANNNSTHWTIQGNTLNASGTNKARYSIWLTTGANFCVVTDNLIKGQNTATIQDSGTGNAVKDNMVDDTWIP